MPNDLYTKTVLTIIAGALVAIACQGGLVPANAQLGSGCGPIANPCYVANEFRYPLTVSVRP